MSYEMKLGPARNDPFDIRSLVVRLRDWRDVAQRERYAGPTPELPSRSATLEIVDNLVAALYPRHYGPPGLSLSGQNEFVGMSLHSALNALSWQGRIELGLRGPSPDHLDAATEIAQKISAQLPEVRALADSDARASFEFDPSTTSFDGVVFTDPGFSATLRHRIANRLFKQGLPLLARIIGRDAYARTGIELHPGAEIGKGFSIYHGAGVFVGETTKIGANVRLHRGVTIGEAFEDAEGMAEQGIRNSSLQPTIEDNVVIHAGASLLGPIVVGEGASIGSNVRLTSSIPAGARIVAADSLVTVTRPTRPYLRDVSRADREVHSQVYS